jgi:hypothetical protein
MAFAPVGHDERRAVGDELPETLTVQRMVDSGAGPISGGQTGSALQSRSLGQPALKEKSTDA